LADYLERVPKEGVPIKKGVGLVRANGHVLGLGGGLETPEAGISYLVRVRPRVLPFIRSTHFEVGEFDGGRFTAAPSRLEQGHNQEDESGKARFKLLKPDARAEKSKQKKVSE